MWQCPLCGDDLISTSSPWHCSNGHSFDVSRRGYVNLLPVQKKGSKSPGDNKQMISARQCFHANKGFAPLMERLAELCISHFPQPELVLYDAGCGEGTYLSFVCDALTNAGKVVHPAGSDISKVAIDLAAKQVRHAQFVVASSFALPVVSNVADIVLQIFAPGNDDELSRITANNGVLIHVAPGADHLFRLKQAAYDMPKPHELPHDTRDGFTLVSRERLQFDVKLVSEEHALALLNMTPFTWRLTDIQKQALSREITQAEGDFVISVWRKAEQ